MIAKVAEPAAGEVLAEAVATLRAVAGYVLPPELDARCLDLGERKEELTGPERAELLAWAEYTHRRSLDRARAQLALKHLVAAFPDLREAE